MPVSCPHAAALLTLALLFSRIALLSWRRGGGAPLIWHHAIPPVRYADAEAKNGAADRDADGKSAVPRKAAELTAAQRQILARQKQLLAARQKEGDAPNTIKQIALLFLTTNDLPHRELWETFLCWCGILTGLGVPIVPATRPEVKPEMEEGKSLRNRVKRYPPGGQFCVAG